MNFVVTNEQMRAAEAGAELRGINRMELMQNAGRTVAEKLAEIVGGVSDKSIVVLAGRGNNGGDGIVLAKRIKDMGGAPLLVFAVDLPESKLAREVYSLYSGELSCALYTHNEENVKKALESCEIIVDCVFGTGFHGELEPKLSELFAFINRDCRAMKLSVDIPSGMNGDTGAVCENAFKPSITLTLGAVKAGLMNAAGFDFAENIVLLDIGIPLSAYNNYEAKLIDENVMKLLPARKKSAHKGDCGKLLNIAGSERYMGAAILSTRAALRMGVGLCTLAAPRTVTRAVIGSIPECTLLPLDSDEDGFPDYETVDILYNKTSSFDAVAVGCGIGCTADTKKITSYVLKSFKCPIILDADGINSISDNINVIKDSDKVIVTPHPAEFSRMVGMPVAEIQANRIAAAKAFAKTSGAVTVLKGANTVIASPDGRTFVNTTGNPALAKGGSGDVLTGIISALAAGGCGLLEAAVLGVYIHGLAADELLKSASVYGILPEDIAEALPFVTMKK